MAEAKRLKLLELQQKLDKISNKVLCVCVCVCAVPPSRIGLIGLPTFFGTEYSGRLPTVLPHDSPNLLLILACPTLSKWKNGTKFLAKTFFRSSLIIGCKIERNFGKGHKKLTEKCCHLISVGWQHCVCQSLHPVAAEFSVFVGQESLFIY